MGLHSRHEPPGAVVAKPTRLTAAVVALCLSWGACSGPSSNNLAANSDETKPITLSIVGTNDLHGGILPRYGRGGLALFGGYVANLRAARAADGGGVLLIDAGDMFQGTLESNISEGKTVVAAYNVLGYAAAAIGNHEFDFGPSGEAQIPTTPSDDPRGALKERAAEAKFPFLAANLIDNTTQQPVVWSNVTPSVMTQVAGINVGIIGVMTRGALEATMAANTHGLTVAPLAPAIATQASSLRSAGATVVIVAAHAGARCARLDSPTDLSSCDPSSEIIDVVREVPQGAIDLVVAGHVHSVMAYEVNGVPIIETFSGGRAFGRVDVTIDPRTRRPLSHLIFQPRDLCAREDPKAHGCDPASARQELVQARYEGRVVVPDPRIAQILAPALAQVRALKETPLGVLLDTPVRRTASPESPLGNLFTDALRESVKGADVALNNTDGALRADLPPGPLTYGRLYEVFPFDNRIVKMTITGQELRRVLTARLAESQTVVGVSGLRVRAQCRAGTLSVTMLRDSGRPIRDQDRLLVVTTDFVATGGDGILRPILPHSGFEVPDDAPVARDVVADWLKRRGGRLNESDLVNPGQPRWTIPDDLPLSCRT